MGVVTMFSQVNWVRVVRLSFLLLLPCWWIIIKDTTKNKQQLTPLPGSIQRANRRRHDLLGGGSVISIIRRADWLLQLTYIKRTFILFTCTVIERSSCKRHTPPFNGPLSRTTRVSRYQKAKTNVDFSEARDSEWQWHLLGHMQVCTSLETDNHASTPPLSFLQAGCPSCRPTNSVKALKANSDK